MTKREINDRVKLGISMAECVLRPNAKISAEEKQLRAIAAIELAIEHLEDAKIGIQNNLDQTQP